jgi:cysteinyl-tRNA synthetase
MIRRPTIRLFYLAARTRNCAREYNGTAFAKAVTKSLPQPKSRCRPRPGLSACLARCFSSSDNTPESQSISLFDSLSESILPLPSIEGKGLGWYTCGPTTYAPAHLGHARTYVCLDIVRRVLEARANITHNVIPPLFVMNITDVDDKILAAAAEKQESPIALARKFEAEFWRDLDALNCLRPHVVTRVTECVESHIVPFIERLVDQGMAYEIDDGVYFHVRAFNERLGTITKYGKLAPAAAAQDLEITSRNNLDAKASQKKDPRDFVLWKRRKTDEPLAWSSPWGEGRPGWHIECSSMIEEIQSRFEATHQFLVHAGGVDLKFPHHTNEIAQSEAYRQGNWVRCRGLAAAHFWRVGVWSSSSLAS